MGLQINTNVTALVALTNLENVSGSIANSIQRLSSGLRINNAADDPSGLVISEGLRAQIDGLNQAISNSQDATNVIKTAEGGLTEVNTLLRNVRQLAVHAANTGVNDVVAVQADQTSINSAVSSIERIAEQTQFGSKNLLDGSSGINASVVDTSKVGGVFIGSSFGGSTTVSGGVTVTVTNAATRAVSVGSATYASVNASVSTVNGTTIGNGGSIVLNGQTISVNGSDTVQTLINKINNLTASTGVSAAFTFGSGSGSVVLQQTNYGANFNVNENESSNLVLTGSAGTSVSGLNATVSVTALALVNNVTTAVTSTFTGGRAASDSGLRVTDTSGNSILLTEAGNGAPSAASVATVSAGAVQFQIGSNAGQTATVSLGNIRTTNLGNTAVAGLNLSLIDVTTAAGATNAIKVVDQAISQVTSLRANLGAFQANTLASTVRYLGVGVENLSASESQIRDTNVATEVVSLTKNQIISQAAQSVLSQANSNPQQVLSLLR